MMYRQSASLYIMLLCAARATAQEESSAADEEARMRFEAGSLAYEQGRYEAALNDFRQAYDLSHRPVLLFNIGAAAQNLRRDREALEAFERYLRDLPDAPNRAAVEARVAILRDALAGDAEQGEIPSDLTVVSTSPSAAAIALTAGGAVVAVTGIVLLAVGRVDSASVSDAERGTSWADVQGAYERAEPLTISGIVGLSVGVVAAAIGLVLWFVAPDRTAPRGVTSTLCAGRF